MEETKKYWKGLEELRNDPEFVENAHKEFPDYLPTREQSDSVEGLLTTDRRDFLKMMGFSLAAVSLAACETPVKKAIPWLNKPMDLDPTIPNYYASSYVEGGDYCSVLVKTREGRPIKVEGNALSSVSMGGTSVRAQASVLTLYDETRYQQPLIANKKAEWSDIDREITDKLRAVGNKKVYLISPTIISPSTKKVIDEFKAAYASATHVSYDIVSQSGLLDANQQSFGVRAVPSYDFSRANTIVSFGADFIGTWISPVEYARQFAKNRKLGKDRKNMSRLFVFETTLSLTGSNADYRIPVRPSEQGLYVAALYNEIAKQTGGSAVQVPAPRDTVKVQQAAKELLAQRGKSLVVCGVNDVNVQILVNGINQMLNNYGNTLSLGVPSYQRQGDDQAMRTFVEDAKAGRVGAVIFYGVNPIYDHPAGGELQAAMEKIGVKVSFADRPDETAVLCNYICPDHHYLESWGDAEPKKGYYSLLQPSISPVFNTRQAQLGLLAWSGSRERDYYQYVRRHWEEAIYSQQSFHPSFREFWNYSLHDGVFETNGLKRYNRSADEASLTKLEVAALPMAGQPSFNSGGVSNAATRVAQTYKTNVQEIELVVYEKIGLGGGQQANNPWLQEFPDPISKACWDNYLTVPQAMAGEMDLKQGDLVKVEAPGKPAVEVPVLVQPGQTRGTVGLALGYGRTIVGKVAEGIGVNAAPFLTMTNNGVVNTLTGVKVSRTSGNREIAQTQTHHTIMARPVVQEATLTAYQQNPAAGREIIKITTASGEKLSPTDVSLWNRHEYPNHAWGMVIDLNSCIGCGACSIACQAENNVPVVGRKEVLNRREMHWIRIDRYYSSDATKEDGFKALEEASENPEVVFQPMMCQHCNNAPCETVCPVLATTHSSEGLNQMTYNRCIGTRYCANNCPYKVRRFNWFSYPDNKQFSEINPAQNTLGRMVLNPDVTVRARGVMEKCSMCVQRLQEGKLNAKREGRRPHDGEINTACAQACPTEAIVFGDMNDEKSYITQLIKEEYDKRAFHVLEEINVRPNIAYLTKIRNKA